MNVEIGAGGRATLGYLRVDIDPTNANVVADARALPFATGSVEMMRAVDVLEHLSYRHTTAALLEWARIIEPGGGLFVQVPDAKEIMRRFSAGEWNRLRTPDDLPDTLLAGVEWRLLGGHADGTYCTNEDDWRWNAHYSLWDSEKLVDSLLAAGFDLMDVVTNEHPNLLCKARRER